MYLISNTSYQEGVLFVLVSIVTSKLTIKINHMTTKVSNTPNAAKLISSLRNTGYDSYTAIEDIVDNSIDAHARNINLRIDITEKTPAIIIADNGDGMDSDRLDQALRLGSISERDEVSDLGKYGMGLTTASISLGRKLEVITKKSEGGMLYSSQDLDEVIKENNFTKILRAASAEEKKLFSEFVSGESGTVIVISKIDRLSNSNQAQFSSILSREIGRIFRKFIESDIAFTINGKRLAVFDPITLSLKETEIYSDEVYELSPSISGGIKNEKIRIKVALLPKMDESEMKDKKANIHNQGFYVMRNNREIASGVHLDVFQKHNDFNRLRMELSFSATLDNAMGVKFSKDGITPSQAIRDFLKQEVGGQVQSIRNLIKKTQKSDSAALVDHTGSETVIAQRSKLLITPEAIIEKRRPRTDGTGADKPEKNSEPGERTPRVTHPMAKPIGARFESLAMGKEGTLFESYQEGKIIVVRWNTDHPFYDQVILANKGDKNIISALDYLVFALASAELKYIGDDYPDLLSNIKTVMSSNLRALLS